MLSRASLGFVVFVATAILSSGVSFAQTDQGTGAVVRPGFEPSATLAAAIRFRNLTSAAAEDEIWVGLAPLSAPPASFGVDLDWNVGRNFRITYEALTGVIMVIREPSYCCGVPPPPDIFKTVNVGDLGVLNYVEITLKKTVPEAFLYVSGELTSTTSPAPPQPPQPGGVFSTASCVSPCAPPFGALTVGDGLVGIFKWSVTGVDLTNDFHLEAFIHFGYLLAGSDQDYIEVAFGSVPPADAQGPAVSHLAIAQPVLLRGDTTITATLDDSRSGGHVITSAAYSIRWQPDPYSTARIEGPLLATDGALDEPIEETNAVFEPQEVGQHEVCARGTDSAGHEGPERCQTFLVTHKFTGFVEPLARTLINVANAGQVVPVRWQLTDADDEPITNPENFRGLFSYPIDCGTLGGDAAHSVEEYSFAAGLMYLSAGRWQFNWKTPKAYANTCRAMYVLFDSGATSPVLTFSFK